MADTDLPNGYGALNRAPRPIASPFGMLVNPWPTPDPNQSAVKALVSTTADGVYAVQGLTMFWD